MSTGKSALILGATGAVGKHLLTELLASPYYTRVGEFGRRVTPPDALAPAAREKLVQKTLDFDKLGEADDQGLREGKWDVVFITLGTTRAAAGSAEAFERIDREYVLAAAKAAKVADPAHAQRLVYCSSANANADSSLLYVRSKGLTERGLAALGYGETLIFRPGFLADAERGANARISERLVEPIMKGISYLAPLSSKMQIPVATLAKAMAVGGRLGVGALPPTAEAYAVGEPPAAFTAVGNKGALALAKEA